jgi:uncharacterized protein DUF4136
MWSKRVISRGLSTKMWWAFVVLFTRLLTTGTAYAQKVATDYDRNVDFARYKTYAWAPSLHAAKDPLWNQRIIENIDRQLASKGLHRVGGGADLNVTYTGSLKENVSLEGFGSGGRFVGGNFSVNRYTTTEGTLVVELHDTQSNHLVWRGVGTETASEKSDKNISKLEKTVVKMFKEYPPKPKD